MQELTVDELKNAARLFIKGFTEVPIPALYGTTDGKAVGTHVEHAFRDYLEVNYSFRRGNSASGIDFPDLLVDLKVTSARQPQSSCPFKDASQKVYGLGYSLLVLVYDKVDDHATRTARLNSEHAIFVSRERTGDYQTTRGIRDILARDGNQDDIVTFIQERNLPLDEIGREALARRVLAKPPEQGYLTISNALQWRLQYQRVIDFAASGSIDGVENLLA